ncbi:FixH family protein [Glaciecola sp. 1036]|uniref:FixH family protein n=1 Tax=Alteromonadaceae TaxID=72275 RepID=UPI003D076421
MQNEQVKPWYKQFWPWFLIAIPVSSMIVASVVVKFATDGTNHLVVDDYYKEGKSINLRLDQIERARELNITTLLAIDAQNATLEFVTGLPETGEALRLNLFHSTQPHRDTEILLARDASGVYRGVIDFPVDGKWRLRLTPMDDSWKIQQRIELPKSSAVEFNP